MKLKYIISKQNPESSILVKRESFLEDSLHFHKEYELVYFLTNQGKRYIGNTSGDFKQGELYLIGSNLPHLFTCSDKNANNQSIDSIVIQFEKDFLGELFYKIPESKAIRRLLETSRYGIRFPKISNRTLHKYFLKLNKSKGLFRLTRFIEVLETLARSEEYCTIFSNGYNGYRNRDTDRLSKVMNYLTENYQNNSINLNMISDIACMTPNAFCRFFKLTTHRTFSEHLNDIRITNACKLLIEGDKRISEIAYLTGFNSLSNFNRQFKLTMGCSPSEYSQKYTREFS